MTLLQLCLSLLRVAARHRIRAIDVTLGRQQRVVSSCPRAVLPLPPLTGTFARQRQAGPRKVMKQNRKEL